MARQIVAVHMSYGGTHCEHIESVRWRGSGAGPVETRSVPVVVNDIDNCRIEYYTWVDGMGAEVGTRHPAGRRPYIQTKADGCWNDNLLKLPRF